MAFDSQQTDRRIVLASGSPRRRDLLQQLGLTFDVLTSDVDESFDSSLPPADVVKYLADKKASAVANLVKDGLVIGADTIVVVDDRILGKPGSANEAKQMLKQLAGRAHTVYTGVAVVDAKTLGKSVSYRSTVVHMRPLTDQEITQYVATGEPMDKAGAYAIQGLGATLVTGIEGCYPTVVGLPVSLLAEMLWEFQVNVLEINTKIN